MELIGWLFIVFGVCFFISGAIALLRFPNIYTRLHALTKADNLGLGFIVIGLALHASSFSVAIKLLVIWLLVMMTSAGISYFIAKSARAAGYGIKNS